MNTQTIAMASLALSMILVVLAIYDRMSTKMAAAPVATAAPCSCGDHSSTTTDSSQNNFQYQG